jgi:hypothetical protein
MNHTSHYFQAPKNYSGFRIGYQVEDVESGFRPCQGEAVDAFYGPLLQLPPQSPQRATVDVNA